MSQRIARMFYALALLNTMIAPRAHAQTPHHVI